MSYASSASIAYIRESVHVARKLYLYASRLICVYRSWSTITRLTVHTNVAVESSRVIWTFIWSNVQRNFTNAKSAASTSKKTCSNSIFKESILTLCLKCSSKKMTMIRIIHYSLIGRMHCLAETQTSSWEDKFHQAGKDFTSIRQYSL